ncbi:UDP-N-acetylmuramoyl-L-alanyl-D-glutamate--2,6-diaminopimelate ligase [bacterium]|nr:UDP-N-acetylmuramoyl-L-alanyl-D-glutamate--2,6-diaminopimelate ligase [candidate division CSSED10-310 bacterium]
MVEINHTESIEPLILSDLISSCPDLTVQGDPRILISGLTTDSRRVRNGDLFAALKGSVTDGSMFIRHAAEQGARAALISRENSIQAIPGLTILSSTDPRAALARIADRLYRSPSRHLKIAGITGTNGKTTVTHMVREILDGCGLSCGSVGTLGVAAGTECLKTGVTTPESPDLQAALNWFIQRGMSHAVMEVSSHAAAWHRVDTIDFDAACFTNLSQDHLDFHKTMDRYLDAKCGLFRQLPENRGTAVLNRDDPAADTFRNATPPSCRILYYGFDSRADIRAESVENDVSWSRFHLVSPWIREIVQVPLPGRHNISNVLAAVAVACILGAPPKTAVESIPRCKPIPGRMERIDCGQPFLVIVDYAHTPDALTNLLASLKPLVRGRLIAVFGCGGDRDRTKRPRMAEAVTRLADYTIITSDNPRTETPSRIIEDVLPGVIRGRAFKTVEDRTEAIREAIQSAQPQDAVVIAGKGHEDYQVIGRRKYPFDDRRCARIVLAEQGFAS